MKAPPEPYLLRLYVTGATPRSARAIASLKAICTRYLRAPCPLEVVDLYQQPELASGERIVAAPTLVKLRPLPPRRLVGDFSEPDRVLTRLGLPRPVEPTE